MAVVERKTRPPPHVFYGRRDPNTGDMEQEPIYEAQEYPRLMYHPSDDPIEVNSDDEKAKMIAEGWSVKTLGRSHAPSQDELRAWAKEDKAATQQTLHMPKK